MKYICPMHPDVQSNEKGRCSKCGMELVLNNNKTSQIEKPSENKEKDSYKPLFIIIGLILLVSLTISARDFLNDGFLWQKTVAYFMAGFFLLFSGFKLIDLKGFAQGYSTYDLLAKRVYSYGYVFPFIELFFGLSMILGIFIREILIAELIIMTFSGLGVAIKLYKKEKFQCVCLGTFLKVPLTKVTLVEDFGMAFLALLLLLF